MTVPLRAGLLVLAYFAFISLGLPDGLLGVGWPSISATFAVPTESVGLLLFSTIAGYLSASVVAGFTLGRLGVGPLLAGSTLLTSLSLTGYAVSGNLTMMVLCGLGVGLGGGAIDTGLNAYAAGAFGPRHMNWMHAFFGLGVALGPLIMTGVLSAGREWRWGYGIVAAAQLLLAAAFAVNARSWAPVAAAPDQEKPGRIRATLALPGVWLGILAFGVYVAVEAGAGLWAFLLLTDGRSVTAAVAGLCVSGYWISLFAGRVVQGVVAERWGTRVVLTGGVAGMVAGSALVAVPGGPGWLAVTGLAVIGFSAAPVFPLLILTTADRVGAAHADRTVGLQVAGAGLGGTFLPAGIGVLMSRVSVEALGPSLLVLSLILLGLHLALQAA